VSVSVAKTGVLVSAEKRRSGTVGEVCEKENEIDCALLVILEEKELVTETESMSSTVTEKTKSLN
jgi:hypothetical protein